MRASRLLSILILLQVRGRLSAETLAREFEVSARTILRDMDHLSAAGVPVYAERGRAGGFALHEGYRTRLTGFTSAEAEALLLAGVGDAAAALGVGAEAAAAQLKLLASLPPDAGASAQLIAARFHVDPTAWYARAEEIECLPALAGAVWRGRRVRVRYESWTALVRRELDPLGLVLKGGLWYLVAAASGAARTYRVSNIKHLEILETPARSLPRFNLQRYWKAWARDFETRLLSRQARIKLSPLGVRLLCDANPAAADSVRATGRPVKGTDWVEAVIPIEETANAARQMLRLGSEVEVLAPRELRAAIAAQADAVASLYRRARGRRPRDPTQGRPAH